jgi:hypothetical protein
VSDTVHGNLFEESPFSGTSKEVDMRATVRCPATDAPITITIKDDKQTVFQGWNRSLSMQCPHCKQAHEVKYRDAYVEGVLSGFQDEFDRVLKAY